MPVQPLEGRRELEAALRDLPRATGKGVLRRVLKKRAQPVARSAKSKVSVAEGQLRDSIKVGTRLSKRQASLHRKSGDRGTIEVFVGAGPLPQAHLTEFGSVHNSPKPFMRPSWAIEKGRVFEGIGVDLWKELRKTAARHAARVARLARP